MSSQTLSKHASWGPLALRVIVGLIFVLQGYAKLQGIEGFAAALSASGYPIATFFAWLVALIELIAGAMLVLGIWTRQAAVPLKVVIVFAILTKLLGGFGGAAWSNLQLDLLLLAALSTLVLLGGGRAALVSCCQSKEDEAPRPVVAKKKTAKKAASKPAKKKSSTKKSSAKKTTKKSKKKSSASTSKKSKKK
ncbi:MAG: DoxX family protein [Candidatus Woesearchaeota archaeon]